MTQYMIDPLAIWFLDRMARREPARAAEMIRKIDKTLEGGDHTLFIDDDEKFSILTFENDRSIEGMYSIPSLNIDAGRLHFWNIPNTVVEKHQSRLDNEDELKAQSVVDFGYVGNENVIRIDREPGGAVIYIIAPKKHEDQRREEPWLETRSRIEKTIAGTCGATS